MQYMHLFQLTECISMLVGYQHAYRVFRYIASSQRSEKTRDCLVKGRMHLVLLELSIEKIMLCVKPFMFDSLSNDILDQRKNLDFVLKSDTVNLNILLECADLHKGKFNIEH